MSRTHWCRLLDRHEPATLIASEALELPDFAVADWYVDRVIGRKGTYYVEVSTSEAFDADVVVWRVERRAPGILVGCELTYEQARAELDLRTRVGR